MRAPLPSSDFFARIAVDNLAAHTGHTSERGLQRDSRRRMSSWSEAEGIATCAQVRLLFSRAMKFFYFTRASRWADHHSLVVSASCSTHITQLGPRRRLLRLGGWR
eukprot:PhM_4_TR17369/c0_g1_i1/m.33576